jgi:hypothetical protein
MGTVYYYYFWLCSPARSMASSFTRFLDHTQRRATVGRTPVDEWSARRRDLYLTTHTTYIHATGRIWTHDRSWRAALDLRLKVPIHVRVWLASPAGLGLQWVTLVRVWSVTSRTLADYIYIPEPGSPVIASQVRTCMSTFRPRSHWDRRALYMCSAYTLTCYFNFIATRRLIIERVNITMYK